MSMSFDSRQRPSWWRLGPWLWLLIGQLTLLPGFGLLRLYAAGRLTLTHNNVWSWPAYSYLFLMIGAGGLLLCYRRAASVVAARVVLWLPMVLGLPITLLLGFEDADWSGWWWGLAGAVFVSMPAIGWIAFLASAPQVTRCYPPRYPPAGMEVGAAGSASRQRASWHGDWPRWVLLLYAIAALGAALGDTPSQPGGIGTWHLPDQDDIAALNGLRHWLALAEMVTEVVAILIWSVWRRWSSVLLLVGALWLPVAAKVALALLTVHQSPLLGELLSASFLLLLQLAMAWSAYLLNAPRIAALYPGRKRRQDVRYDVDVF
jgi:hypothetical protein